MSSNQHHRHRETWPAPSARAGGSGAATPLEVMGRDQVQEPLTWPRLSAAALRNGKSGAPSRPGTSSSWPCCTNGVVSGRSPSTGDGPSRAKAHRRHSATPSIPRPTGWPIREDTSIRAGKPPRRPRASASVVEGIQHHLSVMSWRRGRPARRSSSLATMRRPRRAWRRSSRASGSARLDGPAA